MEPTQPKKAIGKLKALFIPIPEEQKHLAPKFFTESISSLRVIILVSGFIYGLSLVLIGLTAHDPYLEIPELILLDSMNAVVSILWMTLSYRIKTPKNLYHFLFWGMVIILFTNMRESIILENYMSLFLATMAGAFLGSLVAWHIIWTARIQALIALSTLSMFLYWSDELIGPLITILLLSGLSLSLNLMITKQRWTSFFSRYQIEQLNQKLQTVNEQLQEHTNRLQNELSFARNIQQGLLPHPIPAWSHLDVVCYSQPALEIGGDFYSYHTLPNGNSIIAIGDVSGKGVAAALLMAASLSLFSATLSRNISPSERLAQVDRELMPYTKSRQQNCAMCYVEIGDNCIAIVNAGGVAPFVRRQNGDVECSDACGLALGYGIGAAHGYLETLLEITPGDIIVMISDGVIEAMNAHKEMFGFERFTDTIAEGPVDSAEAMLGYMLEQLATFVDGSNPHDDITIAVLRVCE